MTKSRQTLRNVPTAEIVPSQNASGNHRKTFSRPKLVELADNIAELGLAQPITLREIPRLDAAGNCILCNWQAQAHAEYPDLVDEPGTCRHRRDTIYEVVAGERRFRSVSIFNKSETIPAMVRTLSNREAEAIMLTENTSREDLNPMDEGEAYHDLLENRGWTSDEIADTAGRSSLHVKRRLSLVKLRPEIREMVRLGNIPVCRMDKEPRQHGELFALLDHNRQMIALKAWQESGIGVEKLRRLVLNLQKEQSQDAMFDLAAYVVEEQKQDLGPIWGKNAKVPVDWSEEYALINIGKKDTLGVIFENYIDALTEAGFEDGAEVVGTLYHLLVTNRKVALARATVSGGAA